MIKGVTAGNFDVIHPGYIEMFKEMKKNCSVLIILLHTDPSIERPEKLKPILSSRERKDMLESIKYVDDVIRYTYEEQLYDLLKQQGKNELINVFMLQNQVDKFSDLPLQFVLDKLKEVNNV